MFLEDFFSPFKIDYFYPPDDLKPPNDDVTDPVVADVFCRCHGFSAVVPVFACHHLVASFPALTAITAVSDDQCYIYCCWLSVVAQVPSLVEFPAVAGALLLLTKLLLLASLLLLPCCCLNP